MAGDRKQMGDPVETTPESPGAVAVRRGWRASQSEDFLLTKNFVGSYPGSGLA